MTLEVAVGHYVFKRSALQVCSVLFQKGEVIGRQFSDKYVSNRAVRRQHRLPCEVVRTLSLGVFKQSLDAIEGISVASGAQS